MSFERERRSYGILCSLWVLFLLWGCGGKHLPQVSLVGKSQHPPCRIAILPFKNQSKYPMAGLMLYRILMAQMAQSKDFQVIEEGSIRRIFLRGKVYPGQSLSPEIRSMICKITRADALLSGEVLDAEEQSKRVQLAFNLRVRNAQTGHLLWTTYYARNGDDYRKVMHFGAIDTLTGLARQMVIDVLNTWHEKGLGGCGK